MGTPAFAASILAHVSAWEPGRVTAVYTQPDRKANRGHKLQASPVKAWALERGIPVFQPERLKNDAETERLRALKPDFLLVAAYGCIIPKAILDIPAYPPLNVHGSLLPAYRGAAPLQRAIMENYEDRAVTGISIMEMVEALDAGPVYKTTTIALADLTCDELFLRMAEEGGPLLISVLDDFIRGAAIATPQDARYASYAAKIEKKDAWIAWDAPYAAVHAHIRALTSKPGAKTLLCLGSTKLPVTIGPGTRGTPCTQKPGTVAREGCALRIACKDFWYELRQIKPQGKAFMDCRDFANGLHTVSDSVIGFAGCDDA